MGTLNYSNGHGCLWWQESAGYNIMATAGQAREMIESFGCHLSWPELRSIVADRQTLSREEAILAREKWDFTDRPTYYTAIRNLQGFIAYHLNKHDAALSFFHDVLNKDENNINALGNIAFVHDKLFEIKEKKFYEDKLYSILVLHSYEERARAYADKAHAIRYFEQFKRCFRYMRFIERAATIGKKCDGPQRAEWFFDYALALYRRDVQMIYLRKLTSEARSESDHSELVYSECYSNERIEEAFLKACGFFLEVARTSTSRDYQALSWVFLGILVNHDPGNRSLSMAFPNEPEVHLTAEQCYEKGLEIHPEHEIVLRRVGSEYVKLRRFAEAKNLLDKSLSLIPSQFAYRHRALMYLGMYEAASEDERRTEWLHSSVEDFTQALSMKEIHADYSDLGYVYFLLGETGKAVIKFQQATTSEQDDYFDPVKTHQRWARCLEKKQQLEGSLLQRHQEREVRRKILETPLEEEQSDYFSDDFDHYSTRHKSGFVRILRDYHFWTAFSKRRTSELSTHEPWESIPNRPRYRYDFFVWHEERDSRWTVAFVHKLESEHGRRGSIQRRDFEVGKDVTGEIIRCLKESYKFVIILTPCRPTICPVPIWGKWALDQAVMESSKRGGDYIVPIKLRDCTLPDVLQTVAARECEEGQILEEHWVELVQKLTQRPISLNI